MAKHWISATLLLALVSVGAETLTVNVTTEGPREGVIDILVFNSRTYSLSLLHDINNNHKPDKMLGFGPPKEPVGFTNIDKKLLKQPGYKSTLFTFNAQTNEIAASVWFVL
jgi:uncharacterized protein (DUF2141 family)